MATPRSSPFDDPEVIKFIEEFQKLALKNALQAGTDRDTRVLDFQQPEDLEKVMQLDLGNDAEPRDKLLEHCERIIKHSVKTGHPRFFNQLYSGLEPYSLVGAWLTECLNTNIHTYEVAPVFVLMEQAVMRKLCEKLGFLDGEGIFCPGGSFSNFMAVHLSRFRKNPNVANTGLWDMPKMRLYASKEAHYSLKKAGQFLGIGADNVIGIPSDDAGRMRTDLLHAQLDDDEAAGFCPLLVTATSGSTVLGSFDRLNDVADVCAKHSVWMHVDAVWGGGVLLTSRYRSLMDGVSRADSVSWNLHKMSNVPIQASAFLVREKGLLQRSNAQEAEYLFQPDKPYDTSFDIGVRSIQCGRHVDVLKVWMMWKGLGDTGMGERVERAFENAQYFTQKLRETEGFQLVLPEFEYTNVCFWYIPPSLRGLDTTQDWWTKVGKVAPLIKKRMMAAGTMMIAHQPLSHKNLVNFFRMIITNPLCDFLDMDFAIAEIERLGKDIVEDEL